MLHRFPSLSHSHFFFARRRRPRGFQFCCWVSISVWTFAFGCVPGRTPGHIYLCMAAAWRSGYCGSVSATTFCAAPEATGYDACCCLLSVFCFFLCWSAVCFGISSAFCFCVSPSQFCWLWLLYFVFSYTFGYVFSCSCFKQLQSKVHHWCDTKCSEGISFVCLAPNVISSNWNLDLIFESMNGF